MKRGRRGHGARRRTRASPGGRKVRRGSGRKGKSDKIQIPWRLFKADKLELLIWQQSRIRRSTEWCWSEGLKSIIACWCVAGRGRFPGYTVTVTIVFVGPVRWLPGFLSVWCPALYVPVSVVRLCIGVRCSTLFVLSCVASDVRCAQGRRFRLCVSVQCSTVLQWRRADRGHLTPRGKG